MKVLLIHTPDREKLAALADLAAGLEMRLVPLGPDSLSRPLWELAGLPAGLFRRAQAPAPPPAMARLPEMLVLHGLTDGELDGFLAAWRRTGLPPIPLKAVTTPHNLSWTVWELARELQAERQAVEQG